MKKRSFWALAFAIAVGLVINILLYSLSYTSQIDNSSKSMDLRIESSLCLGFSESSVEKPIGSLDESISGGLPIEGTSTRQRPVYRCDAQESLSKTDALSKYAIRQPQFYVNWLIWTLATGALFITGKKVYENTRS